VETENKEQNKPLRNIKENHEYPKFGGISGKSCHFGNCANNTVINHEYPKIANQVIEAV